MLYLSGCDMNAVNIWMETSDGKAVYMLPVKNGEMKEWLKGATSNPSPLKQKCRFVPVLHLKSCSQASENLVLITVQSCADLIFPLKNFDNLLKPKCVEIKALNGDETTSE